MLDAIINNYDSPHSEEEEEDFIYETLSDDGLIKIDEESREDSDEEILPP